MDSDNFPPSDNAALLNPCECLPDLEALERDFDAIYFLDLCAGIEAAILYDNIYIYITANPASGAEPILEPLVQAGVLYDARLRGGLQEIEAIMARPRAAELMARVGQANYWDDFDIQHAIKAQIAASGLPLDLAIEEDTHKTLVLPFRQVPIYLSIPSVERERSTLYLAKLSLAGRYADLSATMLGFRHDEAVHDLDRLELPPLALETLARAHTFDELGKIILDQRDRYKALRDRFRALQEVYTSPDYTLKERYVAKKKIDDDMRRLSAISRSVPSFLSFADDLEKVGEALASAPIALNPAKAAKLLGPISKWIDERAFRWRMRPLVGLVEWNANSSLRDIANVTRILFKHDLNEADVASVRKYSAAVKKYVPPRMLSP